MPLQVSHVHRKIGPAVWGAKTGKFHPAPQRLMILDRRAISLMAGCPECGRSYNSAGLWIMEAAWCPVLQAGSPVPQAEKRVSCPYSARWVPSCSHLTTLGVCEWWWGCGVSLWFMLLMWFNINVMFSEKPRMRTKWTNISILTSS